MNQNEYLIIPQTINSDFYDLLQKDTEYGSSLIITDSTVIEFEKIKGDQKSVEYSRDKFSITYHTHPRTIYNCKFLPPSPFDIVAFTLGDSYIYKDQKIALVIGAEGI